MSASVPVHPIALRAAKRSGIVRVDICPPASVTVSSINSLSRWFGRSWRTAVVLSSERLGSTLGGPPRLRDAL